MGIKTKMGIELSGWYLIRAQGYQNLANRGMTQREIAEAYGVNESTIRRNLARLRLTNERRAKEMATLPIDKV